MRSMSENLSASYSLDKSWDEVKINKQHFTWQIYL